MNVCDLQGAARLATVQFRFSLTLVQIITSSNSPYVGDKEEAGSDKTSASTPVTSSSSELQRRSNKLFARPEETSLWAYRFRARASGTGDRGLGKGKTLPKLVIQIKLRTPRP